MSEVPQQHHDSEPTPEATEYQERAAYLFEVMERMSRLVAPATDPEPGIRKWFKTDVPLDSLAAEDCNGVEIDARKFTAKLHEQESDHEVWEFTFTNGLTGADERHVRGLSVKNKTEFQFLLSPVSDASEQAGPGEFRPADDQQLASYWDGALYELDAEVRTLFDGYDSIGYGSPDAPGQQEDWAFNMQCLAETGATVPGITLNGQLINK